MAGVRVWGFREQPCKSRKDIDGIFRDWTLPSARMQMSGEAPFTALPPTSCVPEPAGPTFPQPSETACRGKKARPPGCGSRRGGAAKAARWAPGADAWRG